MVDDVASYTWAKQLQWNAEFSNYRFLEVPDNSNQKSFLSDLFQYNFALYFSRSRFLGPILVPPRVRRSRNPHSPVYIRASQYLDLNQLEIMFVFCSVNILLCKLLIRWGFQWP